MSTDKIIVYSPNIGGVAIDVIIKEGHTSSLGITELPIETGSKITDHCYIEPKKLELEFADQGAALTYQALVRFQETRQPFTIMSGLMRYDSMLIKDIKAERDQTTFAILKGTALIQEAILVDASVIGHPPQGVVTELPTRDRTDGTKPRGDQPTEPVTNISILERLRRQAGGQPSAAPPATPPPVDSPG